ncbi:MAG: lipoate--protein ligase family protein [SAR324 cluster bacterium]|nr:lipoate--protein ligase family protein [SAR324 cluster bacterium]
MKQSWENWSPLTLNGFEEKNKGKVTEVWHLIEDERQSARFNMAADQVLLNRQSCGDAPTLRIYTWNQATVSLGKNQRLDHIDREWCRENGVSLIRRSTGGQAVLHGGDLTYSLVGDVQSTRFSGGILQIYQTISQSFFHFFQNLGLSPQLQSHSRRTRVAQASQVCFIVPAAFEILIDGRKIIGSAQRQTSTAFLQHGTIPLDDQIPLLSRIFKDTSSEVLRAKVTSLETLKILDTYSQTDLWQRLLASFQEVFQINLKHRTWTSNEIQAIEQEKSEFQLIQ